MSHFVLMPGFDGTGELFSPLIQALGSAHRFTIVRYAKEQSLEECVDTAASFLPDQSSILIAESFSGPIALALMSRNPERIQAVVLCATFAVSPHPSLLPIASRFPRALLGVNPFQGIALRMFCLNGIRDPELIERTTRVARGMNPHVIRSRLRILRDVDLRPILSKISIPALYLRAAQDRLIDTVRGDEIIDGLRNATMREVDGPHMLLQSRPIACAVAIREFVAKLESSVDHHGVDAASENAAT